MQKKNLGLMLFLLLICGSVSLYGQERYKILFLNTGTVKVGNRILSVGDTLLSNQRISWSNEKQAMKVLEVNSKIQRVLVANKNMLKSKSSIEDVLLSKHSLSTRDGALNSIFQLKEYLGGEILLTDSYKLDVSFTVDEQHYFFVAYQYNNELIYKKLPVQQNSFIIDRSIFVIDGTLITAFSTPIRIYYQNADSREMVSDECELKVIPLEL